jgi:hypothetical protein
MLWSDGFHSLRWDWDGLKQQLQVGRAIDFF